MNDPRMRTLHPLRRPLGHLVDAAVAPLFVWWVWSFSDRTYTRWVVEDGVLEWLQVAALAAVLAVCVIVARRERSLVWAGAAVVMFVALGEELAWGSRLFSVVVPAVQGRNVQGDLTIHNIGGLRGLSKTFGALALIGFAGGLAVVRRRPGLAVWFWLPALYCLVRVVDNDPITSRFAKLSEILEFVLYAAMVRAAVLWARPLPELGEKIRPHDGISRPVRSDGRV
jgi:hypothetical protein